MIELIILLMQVLAFTPIDNFDLDLYADTDGYSPYFLTMDLVKFTCAQAYYDGFQLGYCSKELGTLSVEHFKHKGDAQ